MSLYDLVGLELWECPHDLKLWLLDWEPNDLHSTGQLADESADSAPGGENKTKGDWPRLGFQEGTWGGTTKWDSNKC